MFGKDEKAELRRAVRELENKFRWPSIDLNSEFVEYLEHLIAKEVARRTHEDKNLAKFHALLDYLGLDLITLTSEYTIKAKRKKK